MNKPLFRWLLVLIWATLIFSLSAQPIIQDPAFDPLDFVFKKSAHIFEYTIFYLLLNNALNSKKGLAFLLGLAYAFSDEIHQLFTPGRGGSLRDVLIFDAAGLVLGWLISKIKRK